MIFYGYAGQWGHGHSTCQPRSAAPQVRSIILLLGEVVVSARRAVLPSLELRPLCDGGLVGRGGGGPREEPMER